jgi:hypothetical protein
MPLQHCKFLNNLEDIEYSFDRNVKIKVVIELTNFN